MANLSCIQISRSNRPLLRYMHLIGLSSFLVGCASAPPQLRNVTEVSPDVNVIYGTAEVFVDGERQDWGMKFAGPVYFYLTILPEGSNEALLYALPDDGYFFWSLSPGNYTVLDYQWHIGTAQRSGRVDAQFTVPDSGSNVYIGSLEFRGTEFMLDPEIHDRFDEISAVFDERFPGRRGNSSRQLLEMEQPAGSFALVLPQCLDSWEIECDDRFQGVTPTSPQVSSSGFPMVNSLMPQFSWNPSTSEDVSYDLILYEAASFALNPMNTGYTRGEQAAYIEDLREPTWQPGMPLKPGTRYYWSVRLRDGQMVSAWSTQSYFYFAIVAMAAGAGQWFQFRTPGLADLPD